MSGFSYSLDCDIYRHFVHFYAIGLFAFFVVYAHKETVVGLIRLDNSALFFTSLMDGDSCSMGSLETWLQST